MRDWLLGLRTVDATGTLVSGGGKVVKNVAGYDLPKLHVGALGTLGVVVEATFKVQPRPEREAAAVFATGTPAGVGMPKGEFLKPGDEVKIEIGGCGTLVNRVAMP